MKLLSATFLLCVAVVIVSCQMESQEQRLIKRNDRKHYCGRYLTDALSIVCRGEFAGLSKRGFVYDDNTLVDDLYDYHIATNSDNKWPIVPRSSIAEDFRYKRQAGGEGIVEECCMKSCTVKHLQRYCM